MKSEDWLSSRQFALSMAHAPYALISIVPMMLSCWVKEEAEPASHAVSGIYRKL